MVPGTRSGFSAPMFEPEIFRKQMYCIEESICDVVGTLWRLIGLYGAPFGARGIVPPCPLSCTRLRIRLNTISGKTGFNSLKSPLNHGAEQASDDKSETNITA